MNTAVASLTRYRDAILIDVMLLTGLYLLPSISHFTAFPLYKFEPMRIALIIALLFTHRLNAYVIAFTIPLASAVLTAHPEPFKAILMGIFGPSIHSWVGDWVSYVKEWMPFPGVTKRKKDV